MGTIFEDPATALEALNRAWDKVKNADNNPVAQGRTRADFEMALVIYREAARARDAVASRENADANLRAVQASNGTALALKALTLWIAIATIVQAVVAVASVLAPCIKR